MIKLKDLIKEHAWDRKFGEPLPTLEDVMREAEVDDDKIIKYKDKDGESQEMTAGAAKKMDKDHPAKQAWDKMAGGDGKEEPKGKGLEPDDFERDSDDSEPEDKEGGDKLPKQVDSSQDASQLQDKLDSIQDKYSEIGSKWDEKLDKLSSIPRDKITDEQRREMDEAERQLEKYSKASNIAKEMMGIDVNSEEGTEEFNRLLSTLNKQMGGEPEGGEESNITTTSDGTEIDWSQEVEPDDLWGAHGDIKRTRIKKTVERLIDKFEDARNSDNPDTEKIMDLQKQIEHMVKIGLGQKKTKWQKGILPRRTGRELETITVNGKKYRPIKESTKIFNPKQQSLREMYEKIGGK